ncbi:hypothetical protein [Naasia lichenicola]|uniref:Uncharacterized protein n=1 Tax=Naasia lichenicola TaxID=2565933 RepID=A0A4S4FIE7_9MICO|nr:hypothetical protein [Naasia lichenicola]THG29881.1 hypothetical protein E6C64_14620 [Naasia lichenicola]
MTDTSRRHRGPSQQLTTAVNALARDMRGASCDIVERELRSECRRLGVASPDQRWIETTARTISRGY